jgi:hypothetical protein
MSRSGCTASETFDRLTTMSHTDNQRLPLVDQDIVDEAVHRARYTVN